MDTPARTAEDIVGIVPHTLGYIPQDSLVAVIVGTEADGTQSCATTVRTDFTLETAARIVAEGGRWYADMITRACAVSGVFLLLYDDDYAGDDSAETEAGSTGDADEYLRVHRGLIRAATDEIAISLGEREIDTLCAWWISGDSFGRIDEDGENRRPLADAITSACATELIAGGSNPVASPEDLVIRPLSAEDFAFSRRDAEDAEIDLPEAFDILAVVYRRLDRIRCDQKAFEDSEFAEMLDLRTVIAIDSILGQKWSRDALEMILSFDHPGFPPESVLGCAEGELYERAKRIASSPAAAREIVGLSPRSPHPRDVLVGIAFLRAYLPLGHPDVRATAYAVIAWFEWALGGSTMAEQFAGAALELDPDHGMATLIAGAVEAGYLPRWLMATPAAPF